ncbi:MAG TPA: glutathione S-transferase family protein [Anaeromyxobacter sp.]|nr:glutathione S-transferase family protein [Anaeromyxobacter sp.]
MDLYYGRNSGNSARAMFGLFEAAAAWTPRRVDPKALENRSPDYLAINPMGKIPALVDGSFRLWESNAINWYVAEKHPESRLVPSSPQGRASVQRWLFFQAAHVTPACMQVYRTTNARVRAYWGTRPDPAAAEAGRRELDRYLPVLEAALDGRDWLESDFTIADIAYLPHLAFVAEGGFDFAPYPRVHAWLDRLAARPAWRRTSELVFEAIPHAG